MIDEGRRYTINTSPSRETRRLAKRRCANRFKLTPGMTFDQEIVQRDRKQIVSAYSPLGYIYQPNSQDEDYLRIEPKQVFLNEPGKVDLVYQIHEGKPFKLGGIYVRGNHKSMDKLVLREFRNVSPGTLYNSGEVQDAVDRLKSLPYFTSVTREPHWR